MPYTVIPFKARIAQHLLANLGHTFELARGALTDIAPQGVGNSIERAIAQSTSSFVCFLT